jgi:hypothetical protein
VEASTVTCQEYPLINRFSPFEIILMRILFYGFIIIGIYGLYPVNTLLGLIYTGFVIIGLLLILIRFLCVFCPYPAQHNCCLFFPYRLVQRIAPYRGKHMDRIGKAGFPFFMGAFMVIPQLWLWQRPILLGIFWILCLPFLILFMFHYCRHCRHFYCPFNSARKLRILHKRRQAGKPGKAEQTEKEKETKATEDTEVTED